MKDLLAGCMESVADRGDGLDLSSFQELFCKHCRNPDCQRARWSQDQFSARVKHQEERLLQPDRVSPESLGISLPPNFIDMVQEAMKLEISDRNGDWEPVTEFSITDGKDEQASKDTNLAVDAAVRQLSQDAPTEPASPAAVQTPAPITAPVADPVIAPVIDSPTATPEPEQKQVAPVASPTPAPKADPEEGQIIGDEPVRKRASLPPQGDWEISNTRKVAPGATIKLGGSNES